MTLGTGGRGLSLGCHLKFHTNGLFRSVSGFFRVHFMLTTQRQA